MGQTERHKQVTGQGDASQKCDNRMKKNIWRAIVEVGFIIFLFYSNLLMGEYNASAGKGKSLLFALQNIFTGANLLIALVSALVGYLVFEFLRKKL